MLFGNYGQKVLADIASSGVRSLDNFNWTFIALFAFVVYVYTTEYKNKNYKGLVAGLSLYMVHWFFEIGNSIIGHASGYALWTVSTESSSFVLLRGVSWELSMMFAIAGIVFYKLAPESPKAKILGINNRFFLTIFNALFFSVFEIFLAATPAFIWVYPWWGAIPVFITTYIPFFLAAFYVPDFKKKNQIRFIAGFAIVNIILLAILIPLGII